MIVASGKMLQLLETETSLNQFITILCREQPQNIDHCWGTLGTVDFVHPR